MDFTGGTQETLPVEILEKVIRLHRHFYTFLEISLPMARATGMIYFNNFITTRKKEQQPKYALYAAACLHLATKMCECPRSLNKFVAIIYEAWENPDSAALFDGLDGIAKPDGEQDYVKNLVKDLISAEMDVIQHFNFVFEVKLPYEYCEIYIAEILKWHMPTDYPYYESLRDEIQKLSWTFLNDLLFTPLFYIHEPELVALVCIKLAFDRLAIPLVSPRNQEWFNILSPGITRDQFNNLYLDAETFFLQALAAQRKKSTQQLQTPIDISIMRTWHNYPFQKRLKTPQCPPPPFELLQEAAGTSTAFTHMDADHVPFFPPPQSLDLPNPELAIILEEFKQIPNNQDKKKNQNKGKKKDDRKLNQKNKTRRDRKDDNRDKRRHDDRDQRRNDHRDPRNQRDPRDSWDYRDSRDPRDQRDSRDSRDPRDQRDQRDSRDQRDPRDQRDSRDQRDQRDSRDPRDQRDSRDPRDQRDQRHQRDQRDQRDSREQRDSRDPREQRDRRNPRNQREQRDPRDLQNQRDPRDQRDIRNQRDQRESRNQRDSRDQINSWDQRDQLNSWDPRDQRRIEENHLPLNRRNMDQIRNDGRDQYNRDMRMDNGIYMQPQYPNIPPRNFNEIEMMPPQWGMDQRQFSIPNTPQRRVNEMDPMQYSRIPPQNYGMGPREPPPMHPQQVPPPPMQRRDRGRDNSERDQRNDRNMERNRNRDQQRNNGKNQRRNNNNYDRRN